MRKKLIKLKILIFENYLHIIIANYYERIGKVFKLGDISKSDAITFQRDDIFIVFREDTEFYKIAHEVLHAVNMVTTYIGEFHDINNDEMQVDLMVFIFQQILKLKKSE